MCTMQALVISSEQLALQMRSEQALTNGSMLAPHLPLMQCGNFTLRRAVPTHTGRSAQPPAVIIVAGDLTTGFAGEDRTAKDIPPNAPLIYDCFHDTEIITDESDHGPIGIVITLP
eukprot:169473_1